MTKAVDLFAGLGGLTEGARRVGVNVVYAANHSPIAVEWHARNHPDVIHACQDLHQADFSTLPEFSLLIGGPSCLGFSSASQPGRRPKHDKDRATAWAIISCAEVCRPKYVVVENVPNFGKWALYTPWRQSLEILGYRVQEHIVDAADYGVPQNRVRMFVTAIRSAREVTVRLPPPRPIVPISTVLDPEAGGWALVSSKPAGVQNRVARSRPRYGRRFLTQHTTDHYGRGLDRPIGTITSAPQHWHLVDGAYIRPLTVRELARGQSFRDSFLTPDNLALGTHLLGQAVPPLLAEVIIRATLEAA